MGGGGERRLWEKGLGGQLEVWADLRDYSLTDVPFNEVVQVNCTWGPGKPR